MARSKHNMFSYIIVSSMIVSKNKSTSQCFLIELQFKLSKTVDLSTKSSTNKENARQPFNDTQMEVHVNIFLVKIKKKIVFFIVHVVISITS